jgi:hypothetical protein
MAKKLRRACTLRPGLLLRSLWQQQRWPRFWKQRKKRTKSAPPTAQRYRTRQPRLMFPLYRVRGRRSRGSRCRTRTRFVQIRARVLCSDECHRGQRNFYVTWEPAEDIGTVCSGSGASACPLLRVIPPLLTDIFHAQNGAGLSRFSINLRSGYRFFEDGYMGASQPF